MRHRLSEFFKHVGEIGSQNFLKNVGEIDSGIFFGVCGKDRF